MEDVRNWFASAMLSSVDGGTKVKMEVGKNLLSIGENDLIEEYKDSYMFITQIAKDRYNEFIPSVSKKLFRKLKNNRLIYTNEELKEAAVKMGRGPEATFWKFDINKMQEQKCNIKELRDVK